MVLIDPIYYSDFATDKTTLQSNITLGLISESV